MTTCRNCGATVSADYARVFGDNDNVVHECRECTSYTDVSDGASAGLDPDRTGGPPDRPAQTDLWAATDVALTDGGATADRGDEA